jgi:glycosyltransferase involved in cell wall biosynthesis
MAKPTILVLLGAYWPGHEATGPNQSVRSMCEALSGEFNFRIVARDRPFGAAEPLVQRGVWIDRGTAHVCCLPVGPFGAKGLAKLIGETPHALLMLNSFFDREFTLPALVARRLGWIAKGPALLSLRGELSQGALSLKATRKSVFFKMTAATKLLDGVTLHVTSDAEQADARGVWPRADIAQVENFRPIFTAPAHSAAHAGAPMRLAFLGRISPVKGLDIAIEAISKSGTGAILNIFGSIGDSAYWEHCQTMARKASPAVVMTYCGAVENESVPRHLADHDFMILPSLSENFGHAIFEALAAGTPVIIGDKTPWRDLAAKQAGWDVPTGNADAFSHALQTAAAQTMGERREWRDGARRLAEHYFQGNDAITKMRAVIHRLAGKAN